ncbi:Flavodoxin reductases (ferredoxin-NADPH reductases) family 1 [Chondromyces apiculatus DSM 436]|uniref:Flavodoxin reductases (Ferredoxin-NADPH reductases) family 1 n=1 Tax=Chondromyces apiculatus DSM 436 TaxID=1192034 RepID=A0A017SVL6_9BACT|nr:Flavodoxin reductases (ferredoxin-NADPH reductases) family 1 [Chondromyces apiculatus DSM 436]
MRATFSPLSLLGSRLEAFKRDLWMVAGDVTGRPRASFERREPLGRHLQVAAPPREVLSPRTVRVVRVVRETDDAVTLHLVDAEGAAFTFLPGQFLTLLVELDGETLRRAYSICSGVEDGGGGVAVTVKRVPGGRVSTHLLTQARDGDTLRVLGPSGSFTVALEPARRRDLVLLGGGSGITPLLSIAKSVLAREPFSRVRLVFGNRSWDEVIFRDALAELVAAYPGRFAVRHVLEVAPKGWTGGVGRLDVEGCGAELDALADEAPGCVGAQANDGEKAVEALEPPEVFLCGPEGMMAAAREALTARRVPLSRVREERFSSPGQQVAARGASDEQPLKPQPITLQGRGQGRVVVATAGQTVLEAGLRAGVGMPFSCALGGCGACKVRLVEGEVEMEEPNCLGAEERAQGFVLACASRAKSAITVEVP